MESTATPDQVDQLAQLKGNVSSVFMGAPALADPNLIVTTIDWADGVQVIAAQPEVPRNLTATLTDANNSLTGKMTIRGVDPQGRAVEETMSPDGAGGGKTLVGTKIFARVDSIYMTDTAGAAGGDAIVVGTGEVIGLPMDITVAAEVKHAYVDGARVTPDAVAVGESTSGINATSATYDGAKLMYAFVQTTG